MSGEEKTIMIKSAVTHEIIQFTATSHTIKWEFFTETGSGTAQVKGLRIAVIEISNYYYAEAEAWSKTTSTSYVEKVTTGSFTPPTGDYLSLAAINQRNKVSDGSSGMQFTIDES